MAKRTAEEDEKQSKLISDLTRFVHGQVHGDIDWVSARTYWKKRIPELLEHPDELAEALTRALDKAASRDRF